MGARVASAGPIPVLHFSNQIVRGGAEEHMLTLLQRLARKYFRLYIACPPELAAKLVPDLPADVEVFEVSLQRLTDIGAALRLARLLRERRVGILHSHLFCASVFASPIGWLCRVPVIVETPHVREHWRGGWLKGHFFVDRFVGRFVDHYIAVSAANSEYLIREKGLPASKITVIRSASDVKRFDPDRLPPAGLRESLGFAAGDPVLVIAGRLEPQKGHRVMLDAMPAVIREFPRTRLVCLSDGRLRPELEDRVRALGLSDSVRFVGYQPDVADWLALADLSVLPSFFEGLPLAVIESLAAGRPVVASAVDGIPEALADGRTGFTVPPGDPARLAEAICRLLRDPHLRRIMGARGRREVLERFSLERLIGETQTFYLEMWERRGKKAPLAQPSGSVGKHAAPSGDREGVHC